MRGQAIRAAVVVDQVRMVDIDQSDQSRRCGGASSRSSFGSEIGEKSLQPTGRSI